MSENSQYIVSARKYRPASFATVVGQKNLTATLKKFNLFRTARPGHIFSADLAA